MKTHLNHAGNRVRSIIALLILPWLMLLSASAADIRDTSVPQTLTETRFEPRRVYAADLDNNGYIDVISASYRDGKLAWYPNLGAGNFEQQQVIAVENTGASAIYATDLNGDGHIDVLAANAENHSIVWYRNLGGGRFESRQVITSEAYGANSVYASDLDGDGDTDVLSASYWDDTIAWYENLGNGAFGPAQIITMDADGAEAVFAIDLDGDGDVDVLSASSYHSPQIAWHENLGGGVFGPPQIITTSVNGVKSIYAIDLDGDGDADVLSASENDNKIAWYENLGNGTFSTQRTITTNARKAASVFAIDLDGDGDADVLSASQSDNKIAWYENLGGGTFATQQTIITETANGAISVYAADIDGDGDADVLSASKDDDRIAWYENAGDGTFGVQQEIRPNQAIITTDAAGAYSVYAADLSGDGQVDVLSASYNDNKIAWYQNLGSGRFGPQRVITRDAIRPVSVYAIDLDGDGDLDVLSASASDGKIAWYENLSGTGIFGPPQVLATSANSETEVYAADIDGDGNADILWTYSGGIRWSKNLGSGNFGAERIITDLAVGATSIYAIDLDGDGDIDVLSASYNPHWDRDHKIAWYENLGNGTFGAQQVIAADADYAMAVFATDLDGDGDADVLSASYNDNTIAWYENLGNGTFGAQQVITTQATGARSVYAIDLDGDGDADVLSASFNDDTIAWYENLGNGAFGPRQIITTRADGAISIYATDLDGDGDADVLSASLYDNKIAWYQNVLGPTSGFAIQTSAAPSAGGLVACTPNPVSEGQNSLCTATANSGYVFDRWSGDCTGTNPSCTLSAVTAARSVTAHFSLISHAIQTTASPSAGGNLSCTPNPVTHGGNSTCSVVANVGYRFDRWSGACSGTSSSCTLSNVTSAKAVTANFVATAPVTHAIQTTASPSAGGTVQCTPNPVEQGSASTCTATPASGYTFGQWSGDCSGANPICTLSNVTSAKAVTASFQTEAVITHAIATTASPSDGGTLSCTPNPVVHGQDSTCTARPASGYRLSTWSGDCTGTDPSCTLANVTRAQSVTAHFGLVGQPLASQAGPDSYVPGGLLTITNHFDDPSGATATSLGWFPTLPRGWNIVSAQGDGSPVVTDNQIGFTGNLQLPIDFSYQISIPADSSGQHLLAARVEYQASSMVNPINLTVAPNLLFDRHSIVPHSADYRDPIWRIDLTETNRVLSYWRAGAYHISTPAVWMAMRKDMATRKETATTPTIKTPPGASTPSRPTASWPIGAPWPIALTSAVSTATPPAHSKD